MPPERNPIQPPKETRMFRDVPMQALADLLKTLPVPITITQHLDEQREKIFYRYQVGEPTPENPVGICMGATPDFVEAVRLSLQMALNAKEGEPLHQARRAHAKLKDQPPAAADDWIVPEVERGECNAVQASALGLPYRHRVTGDTIAEWIERTRHDQERRVTFRSFGDVLYQTDDGYTERVIADTSRARVVMCESQGSIKLFRVEWTEPDGYQPHKAVYTLRDAMDAFQTVVNPDLQENR